MKITTALSACFAAMVLATSTTEAQEQLEKILEMTDRTVADFDGTYALGLSSDGLHATLQSSDGAVQNIYDGTIAITQATVSEGRALLRGSQDAWLWTTQLDKLSATAKLRGRYLGTTSLGNASTSTTRLTVRDLDTGSEHFTVEARMLGWDIAADGDVVWVETDSLLWPQLMWHQNGVTQRYDIPYDTINTYERLIGTDGVRAVYSRRQSQSLAFEPGRGTILSPTRFNPVLDVVMAGGWMGYTVWMTQNTPMCLSPANRADDISLSEPASTHAISPTGEVMLRSASGLHLVRGPGDSSLVTADQAARAVHRAGAWFVLLGSSVYRVEGSQSSQDGGIDAAVDASVETDAGAPDAEATDAATETDAGLPDAALADAEVLDASDDAAAVDGGALADADVPDAEVTDASVLDAGASDGGLADGGPVRPRPRPPWWGCSVGSAGSPAPTGAGVFSLLAALLMVRRRRAVYQTRR